MPVVDCQPSGQDCDDDHHSKLVDRQGKNDNDTSPVFSNIPIGSAIAVQHEDSGPWTHGTVANMADHNHNDSPYIIQLTKNGRCISRNRWHIKPTTVTADTYLQQQSNKQSNTKTDPLTEILNNINRIPAIYATRQARNTNNTCGQYSEQTTNKTIQEEANIEQDNKKADSSQERGRGGTCKKRASLQENKVNRTTSGCIVRKPDRLTYIATVIDWLTCWPQHKCCMGSTIILQFQASFLYYILPASQPTG